MALKKLFLVGLIGCLLAPSSAFAEWYAGGSLGISMPHNVTNFTGTDGTYTLDLTKFSPDNSLAGGIKGGYFFDKAPNFGIEFNFSVSDPDVDKETITATITGTPVGVFSGQASGDFLGSADVDSLISYGFLAMLRTTDEDAKEKYNGLQPYAGAGFSINVLDINKVSIYDTAGASIADTSGDSNTSVGLLVSAGLNYILNDRIKLYSEYKYKDLNFDYDALDSNVTYGFDTAESSVAFGLTYSF